MANHRAWLHARLFFVVPYVLASVLSAGCVVRLIADYDERTDTEVTALQKRVDGFLIGLEKNAQAPECTYPRQTQFYIDSAVALSALQVRNTGRSKNSITVEQLTILNDSLKAFETLHKEKGEKCMTEQEIEPLRDGFNRSFGAILKLEMAKKRGI